MKENYLKKPDEHPAEFLELTEAQKKQIADYMAKTGRQVGLQLVVDVVEGKIAVAGVSTGAV